MQQQKSFVVEKLAIIFLVIYKKSNSCNIYHHTIGTFATVRYSGFVIRDSKNVSTAWTNKGIYFKPNLNESQIVNEKKN